MTRPLLAMSLLAACQQREIPTGFRADVQASLEGCTSMKRDVQDWCLLEMLKLGGTLPEAPATALCNSMADVTAQDDCLELVAREAESLTYQRICENIQGERMRSSCWLTIADRLMPVEADIHVITDACGRSGDNLNHCLSHIPERRAALWMANGGLEQVKSDLDVILAAGPLAANFVDLGAGLARAAPTLGMGGSDEVCALLPMGGVRVGCEGTIRLAGGGDNGSGKLAPGAQGPGPSQMGQGPMMGPGQGMGQGQGGFVPSGGP